MPPQIMLEFDYQTVIKNCHIARHRTSAKKQYYANDDFENKRLTSNETEIEDQPEKNSPVTSSLEDQQNNDNLRTEKENSQNESELRRSTRDRRPPDRLTYY